MKTFYKSLLVLGFISLSSVSYADLPSKPFDYNKASTNYVDNTSSASAGISDIANKLYFGGTIGPAEGNSYCSGETNCEDKDTAWKLFAGYKVTNNLSAEGAYVNLGDMHKSGENSDISALTINAVGSLPINQQFEMFGKIGAMRWSSDNTSSDENGVGVTYGVGAKMSLNDTTKLRAEWEKFPNIDTSDSEKTDVNMLSIGVELSTY